MTPEQPRWQSEIDDELQQDEWIKIRSKWTTIIFTPIYLYVIWAMFSEIIKFI